MASLTTAGSSSIWQEPLRRWERWGLYVVLVVVVVFGVLVEIRSAFLENRKTDLGTYLRAAWAVRSGDSLYEVTDENGWHYCYPPAFAILLTPLADAPEGFERDWMIAYPVSVAIWYAFSIVVIFLGIHWFATALEESSPQPTRRGSRKWWYSRMLPFYICLAPIGCTLSRGQVNMMVVALTGGMFLAAMRGRRFASGLWLGAAICLKVFPAFLLIFPIWRRDGRSLAGTAAGLVVGLVIIPSLVWSVSGAIELNRQMANAIILPGLGVGGAATRDKELIEMTATDNQSIQAVIHNYEYWGLDVKPAKAHWATKLAHVMIGSMLTGLLLLAYGRRRDDNAIRMLLLLGGLIDILAIVSPVSHTHYFCLALPVVMALAAHSISSQPKRLLPYAGSLAVLIVSGICFAMPMIPFWEGRRELGLSLYGCVLLWGLAWVRLWQSKETAIVLVEARPSPSSLAA
jgi:alpha-1,2-mannosyltransferase